METKKSITKNEINEAFKGIYPRYDPEKIKEVSQEIAVKIIIECLAECGKEVTSEEVIEILNKFDHERRGENTKIEIRKTMMNLANLENLNEKKILRIQANWERKQNEKKMMTRQKKHNYKRLKRKFRRMMRKLQKSNKVDEISWIELERASKLIKNTLERMEIEVDNEDIKEILTKLDDPEKGAIRFKELKWSCKQLFGRKNINFQKAKRERLKWMKQNGYSTREENSCGDEDLDTENEIIHIESFSKNFYEKKPKELSIQKTNNMHDTSDNEQFTLKEKEIENDQKNDTKDEKLLKLKQKIIETKIINSKENIDIRNTAEIKEKEIKKIENQIELNGEVAKIEKESEKTRNAEKIEKNTKIRGIRSKSRKKSKSTKKK